ncbi:B12-binding domain-containing radical SAM protein [Haliangium ochraceum]|uniref:Radical SAM domain protein n=1 Tax=Haliangium ochraceum (strain DSM 14365 / JCM 11303 / SMP-2) TaxID=502025 RepID=D0LTG5_HALO1|nr:radical SAM protein [Haliangium ochraceum]ACY13860.1 Radical SAM domain protein [Haliangium ochraceum DSM 14365]
MKILLLSGLGPTWPDASSFWDTNALAQTFFDRKSGKPFYHPGLQRTVSTSSFRYRANGDSKPLLRSRLEGEPHLTTWTLTSILDGCNRDYEQFPLEYVWAEEREPVTESPEVVALSTTYIYNRRALRAAVKWIRERFPRASLVVGGQYSNLKYARIMREFPSIDYIIRGDAEIAFPMLLDALEDKADITKVPNLVIGGPGRELRQVKLNEHVYIDIDEHPSPHFRGNHRTVPYESMRGCPFTCKFCSFPFASPQWRYKSARKIANDWREYAEKNGAQVIKAMDSTFTVPLTRFRELLELLPEVGINWEAYTRANVIKSAEIVDALEAAHCQTLSIGFESLSEATLKHMNKRVRATDNQRAHELLSKSGVDFRGSFIIGYPGETLDDFAKTRQFLVEDYTARHFMLSVFSLTDETMPVWQDAERYQLEVSDLDDPDANWKHVGMDVATARRMHQETLRDVRWKNENAVAVQWQLPYQLPLVPGLELRDNYRVEKLLERLAFAPKDFPDDAARLTTETNAALRELEKFGVHMADAPAENAAG